MKSWKIIRKTISILLSLSVLTSIVIPAASAATTNSDYSSFIRGVDVSMLSSVEKRGATYYENGTKKDALQILKDHGANYVRLKLWIDPYDSNGNSYGGGGNDYSTDLALAKRAKALGMKVLIDFHLSDFWADPGTQSKPKAWASLSYSDLKTTVYNYIKTTMNTFVAAGITPNMVQIGNEISSGILWNDGKVGGSITDFTQLAELLHQAIQGVRDSNDSATKIILHLDNGGSYSLYQWWFAGVTGCGIALDYDIIGLTYYPMWHGTLDQLQYNMNDISKQYGKDVLIVETAYAWTTADGDGLGSSFSATDATTAGYPASVAGQIQFFRDLQTTLLNVPSNRGLGYFYWEPEWLPVSGANWGTAAGATYIGDSGILSNPWDNLTLFDFSGNVLNSVNILNAPGNNLLTNADFETDGYTNTPTGWSVSLSSGAASTTVKTESGNSYNGSYNLTLWNSAAYTGTVYQTKTGLANGTYNLSAWVKSGGGQNTCRIYAKNFGGTEIDTAVPTSDTGWVKIEVKNIKVTNGTCQIGLYTNANAGNWCSIDNTIFRKVLS